MSEGEWLKVWPPAMTDIILLMDDRFNKAEKVKANRSKKYPRNQSCVIGSNASAFEHRLYKLWKEYHGRGD